MTCRPTDQALGFALGWNYWYNYAITVAAELVASILIVFIRGEHSKSDPVDILANSPFLYSCHCSSKLPDSLHRSKPAEKRRTKVVKIEEADLTKGYAKVD